MKCINCGSNAAWQDGVDLSCPACGHKWTVKTEQENAGMIRAVLHRNPATMPEQETALHISMLKEQMTAAEMTALLDKNHVDYPTGANKTTLARMIIERGLA